MQALELQAKMEERREHKERLERHEKARRRESLAYRVRAPPQLFSLRYLARLDQALSWAVFHRAQAEHSRRPQKGKSSRTRPKSN